MSRLVKQRATGYIFSLSSYRPHLRILGACQVPSLTGSQGSETLRQDDKRTTRKGHYIHWKLLEQLRYRRIDTLTILTEQEATSLMHSCGIKCSKEKVRQWLDEGILKGSKEATGQYFVGEDDVYNFLEYYRWEGTAFEKGINEKEQIERLLKENIELKDELGKLNREIYELECRLRINPF